MSTRQITPEMPTPPRRGLSPLLFPALIWCGLLVMLLVAAGAGLDQAYQRIRDSSGPRTTEVSDKDAAEKIVREHPRLVFLNSQEQRGEITYRDRDSNKTFTISYSEAARRRFPDRIEPPEVPASVSPAVMIAGEPSSLLSEPTVMEAEPVTSGGLLDLEGEPRISLETPSGLTSSVLGSKTADLLPAWLPSAPDWTLVGEPETSINAAGREIWRGTAESPTTVDALASFLTAEFTKRGFTVTRRPQNTGRLSLEVIRAEHPDTRRSVAIALTREGQDLPTRLAITAESAP